MGESEIPFSVLAAAAADGVILIDEESTVLFVNPAAGQLFGYEPAQMVGKPFTCLMPERHRQDFLASLNTYLSTGQRHIPWGSAPLKGLRKSGEEFPAEVSVAEHTSHGKRFFTGFVRDITERKRMEKLQERRVRHTALSAEIQAAFASRVHSGLRSILQASAEAIVRHLDAAFSRIWMLNTQENLLELQASAGQYTRLDGEFARMQFGERHVGLVAQQRRLYIANDLVNDPRTAHPAWAKQERLVALAGYPLLVEGRLIGVLAIFARQTFGPDTLEALASVADTIAQGAERKQAEEKLRESEERFRQLTENINGVFWISDADLQSTIYVNPAYETIWGRSCESLYASPMSWIEAVHPEDKSRVVEIIADRQLSESFDMTYRIVRPDGSMRWIRDRGFPVHDAAGRVIRMVGAAEDVTERRQLEMQLYQAQKMDAVGQLAAGVAHDFNNLLTVISGHSELLATISPADERWQDSIAEIRRATELGSTSIRQLLTLSCRQILEPKVLDLNVIVAEAGKMLSRIIGEHVRLTTLLQPHLSPIRADPGQLNQLILNLAVNARDAMPQGGSLTLETHEIGLNADDVKAHNDFHPGRYVVLTVTDTGWGMAPDVQARIFEPFFTNKAEGMGTGLGLSVVLGIVRQSGGHIEVESKPGVGTEFKIYLPAAQEPADGPAQDALPKSVGGSETVLLVEDEEPVRNITTLLLESLGYRVLQAENGQDALRLFEACREKFDLLMTDVVMPDLSGREVAEALQALDPNLRILFHSGYTDDTVVRMGILHEKVAFLKKPFTLDVLASKIREVLDRP